MELETYEANLADIALQEQTFYETKPTVYQLQMASQLMSNNQNGGNFMTPGAFPLLTPIISSGGKGKKKKSVKFLTYVQVSTYNIVATFDLSVIINEASNMSQLRLLDTRELIFLSNPRSTQGIEIFLVLLLLHLK